MRRRIHLNERRLLLGNTSHMISIHFQVKLNGVDEQITIVPVSNESTSFVFKFTFNLEYNSTTQSNVLFYPISMMFGFISIRLHQHYRHPFDPYLNSKQKSEMLIFLTKKCRFLSFFVFVFLLKYPLWRRENSRH